MEKGMAEGRVIGEDLNGLGLTLKAIADENITNPRVWKSIKNIIGTLVVRETDANVTATLFFEKGEIQIQNEVINKPSAYLEAGFEELAALCSGQVGPIRALITRRVRARGNLFRLLKMSKILIGREE